MSPFIALGIGDTKNGHSHSKMPLTYATGKSRDGRVVRLLASQQSGPGSIPGYDIKCGWSLLFVLVLTPRHFSPGTGFFPLLKKSTFSNYNSIWLVSPNSHSKLNAVNLRPWHLDYKSSALNTRAHLSPVLKTWKRGLRTTSLLCKLL